MSLRSELHMLLRSVNSSSWWSIMNQYSELTLEGTRGSWGDLYLSNYLKVERSDLFVERSAICWWRDLPSVSKVLETLCSYRRQQHKCFSTLSRKWLLRVLVRCSRPPLPQTMLNCGQNACYLDNIVIGVGEGEGSKVRIVLRHLTRIVVLAKFKSVCSCLC